jgi:hypothetical protein
MRLDCVLCYVPGPVLYVWKESGTQDVVFTLLIPRPSRTANRIAAAGAHPVLSWLLWSAFMLIQQRIYGHEPHHCRYRHKDRNILDMTRLEFTDEQYDKLRRA